LSKELAALFARHFIARPDVKAVQFDADAGTFHRGDWFPDSKIDPARRPNSPHLPHGFKMQHLLAHIAGERTYGHYMLSADDMCKMFAFDIDLTEKGECAEQLFVNSEEHDPAVNENGMTDPWSNTVKYDDLRSVWQSRAKEHAAARTWLKYQMKMMAHVLASKTVELDINCAVAYSGSKGVHVYGFMPEPMPAAEVRAAAIMVLEMADEFELLKGKHFFRHKNQNPHDGFPNFTIEVFPKQTTLEGKDLGNLMRLPLGKNWKNPNDPTFFLDMTSPIAQFKPVSDPVALLTNGNPFV
jgi:hypothetical protein